MVSLKPNFGPTPFFFFAFRTLHTLFPANHEVYRHAAWLHVATDLLHLQSDSIGESSRNSLGTTIMVRSFPLSLSKSFPSSDTWSCNVQTASHLWCTRFIWKGLRSVFFEIKKQNIIPSKGAMVLPGPACYRADTICFQITQQTKLLLSFALLKRVLM